MPAYRLIALSTILACLPAQAASGGSLAGSAHFQVYAQAGDATARSVLISFERLHAFFLEQTGFKLDNRPPIRVIAFRTREEYEPYRLRPTADAYYVGAPDRDYIVMTSGHGDGDFRIAAHEYAHFILRANSLNLPPWLNEGIAEFFSAMPAELAGKSASREPIHARTLRNRPWMPLAQLLALPAESPVRDDPADSDLFYAQSWALADMLMSSSQYASRFQELIPAVSETPSTEALPRVYGRTLDEISRDLQTWIGKRKVTPLPVPRVAADSLGMTVSDISAFTWRSVTADLLSAIGRLDQADASYRELAREAPDNPEIAAAQAAVSLQRGDYGAARAHFNRALEHRISDPGVCYRYAVMAQNAGFVADEVRPALEWAIALKPDFDDARYHLALLENNAGHHQAAVEQLRAMHSIAPGRQFQYWTGLAYALSQMERREEAKAAAERAQEVAGTSTERAYASELAIIAQTDLVVQFTRDSNGNTKLVHRRVSHDSSDWNPFIEPGDRIVRVDATLREIDCGGRVTRLVLDARGKSLSVAIPDPGRVQMRNAPPDFQCGPQPISVRVTVVYAEGGANSDGIVRGIEFH